MLAAIVFCVVAISCHEVSALNIDTLSPTVVNSGLTDGADGFGFTLTQHQFTDGRKTVFVAAPKADGAFVREGGVFSCPYVNEGACQFEPIFQTRQNVRGDDPFSPVLSTLNISFVDQLLGYSVRSFPNQVVACAPLYVHRPASISAFGSDYIRADPNGRCVILDKDLSPDDPLQLFSEDVDSLRMAGVDIGVTGQDSNERLAFGSVLSGGQPTPTGRVFLTSLDPTILGTEEVSSPGGVASSLPLTGYHIELGSFTSAQQQIATSAPRGADHLGRVEIMSIGVTLVTEHTIIGQEPDGYFGYDFAVLNFDPSATPLDGLVVGCPLCARESGRVYVYTNTGSPSNPFAESAIEAPSLVSGRFGLAVENIGDIDLDGISDIAVSAPYEGQGVVYIYRGAPSGLVADNPQVIPAVTGSSVFGYSLAGGLDIDDNGYPDVTVGDLSGSHVTSYRTAPLVNVTFELVDRKVTLDVVGDSDRLCRLSDELIVQCFNVTPCFQFQSDSADVTQFAVSYVVTVDGVVGRAGLYEGPGALGGSSVDQTITMAAPGALVCGPQLVFGIRPGLTDTSPLTVVLSVDDVPSPLALVATVTSDELGGSLHPVLRRYERGDIPLPLSLEYDVNFNVNCTGGASLECEPDYEISILDDFGAGPLVLAAGRELRYRVNLTNIASDDGISPTLLVQLPRGIVYEQYVSLVPGDLSDCNSRPITEQTNFTTAVLCSLRSPTLAGTTLQLELVLRLNESGIPLDSPSLEVEFSVLDGSSGNVTGSVRRTVALEAIGDYEITSLVSEESYQASRDSVYRNSTHLPLNETEPVINIRVSVRNSRAPGNGTSFPRSQLLVHLPVESSGRPLLIPTSLLASTGDIYCSQYQAVPQTLSPIQEPTGFLPPWSGETPSVDPRCQQNGRFSCGVVICSVVDLSPSDPPTQITLFARLFSPSVMSADTLEVWSEVTSETALPQQGPGSVTQSVASFRVVPAVMEVIQECVPWWVVVVSVVIGMLALVAITTILAVCGLFRRWYKTKKTYNANGVDSTDSGTFQRRTIPPIPGLTDGTPQLTSFSPTDLDKDKEAEAEAELEREQLAMVEISQSPVQPHTRESQMTFDPAQGVHGNDGGEETDL